jgi:Protein kinase domain/SAP domain
MNKVREVASGLRLPALQRVAREVGLEVTGPKASLVRRISRWFDSTPTGVESLLVLVRPVDELRRVLNAFGLPVSGRREVLIERIQGVLWSSEEVSSQGDSSQSSSTSRLTALEITALCVIDLRKPRLREICDELGLDSSGGRTTLITRIAEHVPATTAALRALLGLLESKELSELCETVELSRPGRRKPEKLEAVARWFEELLEEVGSDLDSSRSSPRAAGAREARRGRLIDGRFRLGELLGSGGFCEVFACRDERLRFPQALVLKRAHVPQDRLDDELRLAWKIAHSNVVTCLTAGVTPEGHDYLVMLDAGRPLARSFEDGPLPLPRVVHLLDQAASALDYAHSKGVIHGDVSPANVLVDDEDHVRLTDFGLSVQGRLRANSQGELSVCPEQRKGYHRVYAAPEVLNGDQLVRRSSDQWSLAAVALALLLGRDLRRRWRLERVPGLDAQGQAALERALSADPAARFPTCRSFLTALRGGEPATS